MEKSTVKEVRVIAKQKGITPIPGRKADLIAAIKGVEDRADLYNLRELKALCVKHKDTLGIRCAGKGITYNYLLEKLSKAGIIMVVESSASEFEEKLKEADPELHSLAGFLVPHIEKVHFLLVGKLGRKKQAFGDQDPRSSGYLGCSC